MWYMDLELCDIVLVMYVHIHNDIKIMISRDTHLSVYILHDLSGPVN